MFKHSAFVVVMAFSSYMMPKHAIFIFILCISDFLVSLCWPYIVQLGREKILRKLIAVSKKKLSAFIILLLYVMARFFSLVLLGNEDLNYLIVSLWWNFGDLCILQSLTYKAQSRLKKAADKHWSDGALEVHLLYNHLFTWCMPCSVEVAQVLTQFVLGKARFC